METGELSVDKFLSGELQGKITEGIETAEEKTFKSVKLQLGNDFSYRQIKFMFAHLKSLEV